MDAERARAEHARQSPWRTTLRELDGEPHRTSRVRTLRAWREVLAASGGTVNDPAGKAHPVSLEPWSADDPDATLLELRHALPDEVRGAGDIVPGSVYARVSEVDPNARPRAGVPHEGPARPLGATLRALRLALAAQDGRVQDPDGATHVISLDEWEAADPDATWLTILFCHQQRSTPLGLHGSRCDVPWHWAAMDALGQPAAT